MCLPIQRTLHCKRKCFVYNKTKFLTVLKKLKIILTYGETLVCATQINQLYSREEENEVKRLNLILYILFKHRPSVLVKTTYIKPLIGSAHFYTFLIHAIIKNFLLPPDENKMKCFLQWQKHDFSPKINYTKVKISYQEKFATPWALQQ